MSQTDHFDYCECVVHDDEDDDEERSCYTSWSV